ncbi:metal-dependent transcriptional regulator [Corynebacterium sp. H130]|uniref:metal-dependent transcriptional regulator n=1 Tax=Corynebacterium sp. H130 TaxID=3133444 RepID=UPI0030A41116
MELSDLSTSHQNYVKAIWGLQEWSNEPVTKSALAQRVEVKLSTASDAVRKLTELGLVQDTRYGAVSLTEVGEAIALQMVRRHRLIESYLVQELGYSWDQVHVEAEVLEHAVSDFLVNRLEEKLGFPIRDPHGDPIPRADGSIEEVKAINLDELRVETPAKVERISDEDPELLKHVARIGLKPGTVVERAETGRFSPGVSIRFAGSGESAVLNAEVAHSVWVRPL